MTATNKLALELLANAAANQTLANTTFAQLNQLVQAGAVDKDLATPPGSPANEALYIVAGSPTGAWSGKASQLAYWLTSTNAWQFIVPREGFLVHVNDEDDYYKYDGAAWGVFSPGGGLTNPMTTLGDIIRGGASGVPERVAVGTEGQVLTVVSGEPEWAASAGGGFTGGTLTSALNEAPAVTIASASTVNIGAAAANTISITGTTTITAFDTIANGAVRLLEFAGALTLTHNGTSLILPTGANIVTAAGDVAEFRSLGSGNWRCVGYLRADGTPLAGGGGGSGLTNFVEAKNTSSPNVSVPAVSLSVSISEANGDFVLSPKGSGAIVAQIPDLTTVGGAKRGQYAIDLQRQRTAATQVASGNYSAILYGQNNTSSGPYAFSSGLGCLSSAAHSWAVGDGCSSTAEGAYSFGKACLADSQYAQATGYRATNRGVAGALARSGGGFYASVAGAAQREWIPLTYQTTNATPAVTTTNQHVGGAAAASNQVTLPDNSAYRFDGRVVARSNGGDAATWDVKGLAKRGSGAGTISLVGTPVVTQVFADAGATGWVVAVGVNTTIGCLTVTVTGAASTIIRWNVEMDTAEVTAG